MESLYLDFKNKGLNRSRDLDLTLLKDYLLNKLEGGDKSVFDDIVSINTFLIGYESTVNWIDEMTDLVGHNKAVFNKLKVMGQFNELTEEEILLKTEINANRISPVVFHRYLSVKLRQAQIESALGFLSEYSPVMIEQRKYKIIYDWAIRLQAWNFLTASLKCEDFRLPLFEQLSMSERERCIGLIGDDSTVKSKPVSIKTYCVSLEYDYARFVTTKAIFSKYIISSDFIRHLGVLGSQVPDLLCNKICSQSMKGATSIIGCTLSHLKIYEDIVSNNISTALVVEDDAVPSYPINVVLPDLDLSLVDILYVNDKNCIGWEEREHGFHLLSASEDLCRHGTYGYMITYTGAKKILEKFNEDGIYKPIDGQLKDYSVNGVLNAYCLNTPLITHFDGGFSRRLLIDIGQV